MWTGNIPHIVPHYRNLTGGQEEKVQVWTFYCSYVKPSVFKELSGRVTWLNRPLSQQTC